VYVGHAAIALALKAREPRIPTVLLVLASFGPDWTETILGYSLGSGRDVMWAYSHCIPGVILGGALAAAAYALLLRRPGASYVLLAWLLHWPADFLTSRKPLFDLRHRVGLDLYHRPVIDFALEGGLVVVCCIVYARSFAAERRQRRWVVAMGAALVAMQVVLDYGLRNEGEPWRPSLAQERWQPHLTSRFWAELSVPLRMPLALSSRTITASVEWPRENPEA
jgi:hypothetical protein